MSTWARLLVTITVPGLLAAGCAVVGPAAIRSGRSVYNDAIVATNNQQVLAMIVRTRYGEPTGLLAVASVTASVRLQATAGVEAGIGPDSSFEQNLVPLSAGVVYEENPTISYSPVQDEEYLRQLLSPLPMDLTVLLLRASRTSPRTLTLLIRSINGIHNPDFLEDPSVEVDARFARIAELLSTLDRRGHLTWAQELGDHPSFALVLQGEGERYAKEVSDLHALLGMRPPDDLHEFIALPVYLGIGKRDEIAIRLGTRSIHDLFNIAAASVDVPEEHVESGLAHKLPPVGPAGECIHIRRSEESPGLAMVAVQHHGWWYAIDGTDAASKETFRLLEGVMSVRIADAIGRSSTTPILTVPVR